jgi:hypothetical protein
VATPEFPVAWLWTDTLASLLVEHDGVAPEAVLRWMQHPVAYRLDEGIDPLTLARRVLLGGGDEERSGGTPLTP